MNNGALRGLKLLELGDFISAPYCGKLLADLGAEVIKIPVFHQEIPRRAGALTKERVAPMPAVSPRI
jgi:crotonobetainyl-CoA:carnitine CoA-transferase CaiB-like acyl-CoA transferase